MEIKIKKNWWNKETDNAILQFTQMKAGKDRDKLYTEKIHPAFIKLTATVYAKSSHWHRLYPLSEFIGVYVPELYEDLLKFKDRRKSISLFTYFFVRLKQRISLKRKLLHQGNEGKKDATLNYQSLESSDFIDSLTYHPNFDTPIDMMTIINSICNLINTNLESLRIQSIEKAKFGKAIIEYLKITSSEDIDWKELRNYLKLKFPQMSKQNRMNLLRHYINILKKDSVLSQMLIDSK